LFDKTNEELKKILSVKTNKELISLFSNDIKKIKDFIKSLTDNLVSIKESYELVIKEYEKEETKQDNTNDEEKTSGENDENGDEEHNEKYIHFINEKTDKVKKSITKLVPEEVIAKLAKIPNIKKLTTAEINLERLNKIMYEVNYTIKKLKDKGKNTTKLQRMWDLNYQDTLDYFQSVIDINLIRKQVTGNVKDPIIKDEVEKNDKEINEIVELGFLETVESGAKFDNTKLYGFVGILKSPNKKEKNVKLLLSPISKYIDTSLDKKIFWFKLFGAYKMEKNNIIRYNPFKNLTSNKKLVEFGEYATKRGHFYVGFELTIQTGKPRQMYVYYNNGGMFFNNNLYEKIDKIKNQIINVAKRHKKESTAIKELAINANIFRLLIHQRFTVDDNNLKQGKYPGITTKDVLRDDNIDITQSNHKAFINTIDTHLKQ